MKVRVTILTLLIVPLLPLFSQPTPRYAERYTMETREGNTVLTINDAWPGAPDLSYNLGTLQTERIVSLSTTFLPHITNLDKLDSLLAVDTGSYVYNDEIRRRVADGTIMEVGVSPNVDVEKLISLRPDLVLLSTFTDEDPVVTSLERAGIPVIVIADWRETTPLGRAEWIRVFGELLDRSVAADRQFRHIERSYTDLTARVSRVTDLIRPKVLVNAPYQGAWYLPAGEGFLARMIDDAGGDYLWRDTEGTGSFVLDIEAVITKAVEADVWINLGYGWASRADARNTDPRFAALPVYQANEMYHYNRRVNEVGGNDYWESGASRPDLVLADLVQIFHPELLPDHEAVYYRRLDR